MERVLKHGNRWKKEKGLTLLETIIALSIIVIVSISVVSMTIYSSNALSTTREKSFFYGEIDNYVTLFLSYNEIDYASAFNKLNGSEISGYEDVAIYYNSNYEYTTLEKSSYHTNFVFSDENNTLTMTVYDFNNNSLYLRSVSK